MIDNNDQEDVKYLPLPHGEPIPFGHFALEMLRREHKNMKSSYRLNKYRKEEALKDSLMYQREEETALRRMKELEKAIDALLE